MRKSRFTEEQIVGILQEYGSSVKRLIRGINRSAERGEGLGALPQAQGNRASEALDECAQEVIAPACLFELHAVRAFCGIRLDDAQCDPS